MMQMLLKGGQVVTMDESVPDMACGDVLIAERTIAAIGTNLAAPAGAEIIDAAGMIVMPGFVDAHLHTWQTGLRGIAADWTVPQYLRAMHARIATQFRPEDIYIANLVGSFNQIHCGVTTVADWCHNNPTPAHTDAAIEGLQDSGIRAVFLHGSPKPDPKAGHKHFSEIPHPRSEIVRLSKSRMSQRDGRVMLGMAILGPAYSVYEVSRHDMQLAREFDLVVSMHVGGGAHVAPDGFQRLAAENLVSRKANIVHGNNLSDDVLRSWIAAGGTVTVTPDIELQMGFGDLLTGKLRSLGSPVSLGVDIESSIGGDMFSVTRMALQVARNEDNKKIIAETGNAPERVSISCREALEWTTTNGAYMLGLEERVGSLTPGKQADIVMIRAGDLNLSPVNDPIGAIVLHANASNVDTVIIAGKVMKQSGRLLTDVARKQEMLASSSRRILEAAGIRGTA